MTDRGLKKWQTKNKVVQGTLEGRKCEKSRRTRPECNSGIRDRGAKQHLRLKTRKTFYDAIELTLGLEIAKRVVGTSVRLQELGDWLLWKCRPPPKRKR
jgi:hypothetical protein